MSNNSLRPPWIKTKATRNVAKRARLAAIIRRIEARDQRAAKLAAIDAARQAR